MDSAEFDPIRMLRVLRARGVRFVMIGGLAARFHGSPSLTNDLDVCYERSPSNLEALTMALHELRACLRGVEPGLPFQLDARTLGFGDTFTFITDAGAIDCLATPSGTGGFDDLTRKAVKAVLGGVEVEITSLDDLIRMKRAAGRPKDRIELEILGALRDEIDGEKP